MYRTQGFADELQKLAAGSRAGGSLKNTLLRAMRSRPAKAGLMLGAGGLAGGALGLSSGRRKGYEAGTGNVEQVAIEALQMGRQQGVQAGYQFAMDQMLGKQASAYDGDGGYGRVAKLNDRLAANTRDPFKKEIYKQEAAEARQNAKKFKKGEIKHRKGISIYDTPYSPEDGPKQFWIRGKKRARLSAAERARGELSETFWRQLDLERPNFFGGKTRPGSEIEYTPFHTDRGSKPRKLSPEGKKAKGSIFGAMDKAFANAARSTPGTRGYQPEGPAAEAVKKVPMSLPEKKK